MESLANAMENLTNGIRSSTEARISHEEERMEQHHEENRERAKNVKETLASGEKARVKSYHNENKARETSLSEIFSSAQGVLRDAQKLAKRFRLETRERASDVKEFLGSLRAQHQGMAEELKTTLGTADKKRVKNTRQVLGDIRVQVGNLCFETRDFLGELAADFRKAHEIWTGRSTTHAGSSPGHTPSPRPKKAKKKR